MRRFAALVLGVLVSVALAQDEKEVVKRAVDLKKQVTEIRGYKFSADVGMGVYSKDQLRAFMLKELKLNLPQRKEHAWTVIGQKFGFFPKDFKLLETYIEMLTESVAGFYHPRSKELKLIKEPGKGKAEEKLMEQMLGIKMADVYLVHELTHAAQDQAFDLASFKGHDEKNDDLSMALDTVVEGEASLVHYMYMFKDRFDSVKDRLGEQQAPNKKYPRYLYSTLTFPYTLGVTFVIAVHDAKGWDGIANLYKEPPLSTEQVLHPEKYLEKRDHPQEVKLPVLAINKVLGKDWKRMDDNVMGEYVIRLLFEEFKLKTSGIKAAAGWDGDRFSVWERAEDKRSLLVWYSTWDDETESKEFFDAYAKLLGKKYADATEEDGDDKILLETKSGRVLLERRGTDVLIIEGAEEGLLKDADEIWNGVKKSELKKFTPAKVVFG